MADHSASHQFIRIGPRERLDSGWELACTAPHALNEPHEPSGPLEWRPAVVPGTVAQSIAPNVDSVGAYDAQDWWYRCRFDAAPDAGANLFFEGLATLADIWLNGKHILSTRNMFTATRVAVGQLLREHNELAICFRSLDAAMAGRHPRPRWKTALVEQQALRWHRTTLLGRIPGWAPPIEPVGPWRGIWLEHTAPFEMAGLDLQTSVRGTTGVLHIAAELQATVQAIELRSATLVVGSHRIALPVERRDARIRIAGQFEIDGIALWWPHTHGEPHLHSCAIELDCGDETLRVDCGRVGFKAIALDRTAGRVQLRVNDTDIFCRGACWTSDDIVALQSTPARLRQTLQLFRDAGANMLRIGGTMLYESDDFYALCDELGLLVWQDFMFASMDYPFEDATFRAEVEREVEQQLRRLQRHASIAMYCGNSEVEQQAAMVGLPSDAWSHEFFSGHLPRQCALLHRDIPYFASTPSEGAMPFHVSSGLAHYYSVSAYRKPLTDVKHAHVRFATECLCFANVPDPRTIELLNDGAPIAPHHPLWKQRIGSAPATYDFEAIRDDYLKTLFTVDPAELRHCDLERYHALSRVVSGELMKGVYAQWRKPADDCGGGLIWFGKDFWPGAGWGFIDSTNRPKAAYWYLRRAWAPRAVLITDEGLDGLQLHIVNETAAPLAARIELEIFQHGKVLVAGATTDVNIDARGATTLAADALLGRFFDTTYAYRFGPPQHDLIVARLIDSRSGTVSSEDFHLPLGLARSQQEGSDIRTHAEFRQDGTVAVTLQSEVFAQNVALWADDFLPDDNYFHLAPKREKRIVFTPGRAGIDKFKAYLSALNRYDSITLRAEKI